MIIVTGQLTMAAGIMPEMAAAVAAMRPKVLAEQGCHQYSLLAEETESGIVNVVEIWDDDAALALHLKQPWILDFLDRFMPHLKASTVKIYDVAGVRPLPT